MKIADYFFIEGEKNLIFRKEGDKYITFDPERLEFFKLNHIGAEIMYYISKQVPLKEMVTTFEQEYKIPSHIAEKDIINFTLNCSFSIHIKNILKDLGFDSEKIA